MGDSGSDATKNAKVESVNQEKKRVATFLGYEISAPESTKNPLLRLFGLVFVNILLLVLLRLALNH